MSNNKVILVTGGTGKQGGAVARNLAKQGFRVKALTRNTESSNARRLEEMNICLIKGDLNDVTTYREHLKDVDGIFSVQTYVNGIAKELHQGIALASIAKEYGVRHFLYSSILGFECCKGVPHIENKFKIEEHIKKAGLPFTIVRPASLYENFMIPQVKNGILKGKLVQPVKESTLLQYISTEDIGKAATKIFLNPEDYLGKTIPLAVEQYTSGEVAGLFSSVLNRKMKFEKLPALITRIFLGRSLYGMFKLVEENNNFSIEDVDATRQEITDWISLSKWVENNFKE